MPVNSVMPPYEMFMDAAGNPLEAGFIYIGNPGLDARANPKAAYFDAAFTVPCGPAIRTSGGYPVQNGTPATIYVDGNYSITVTDMHGALIFSSLSRTFELGTPTTTLAQVVAPDGNLIQTGFGFAADTNTGIIRPAPDALQLVAGGVPVATLQTAGTFFNQPVTMNAPLAVAQGGTGSATAGNAIVALGAQAVATPDRVQFLYAGPSTALPLPAGGTWAYFWFGQVLATSVLQFGGAGAAPGGTELTAGAAGYQFLGFAWRTT